MHYVLSAHSLAAALPFASSDNFRPQLCGVHVSAKGELRATDGHRALILPPLESAQADAEEYPKVPGLELGECLPESGIIVPAFAVKAALKAAPKKVGAHFPLLSRIVLTWRAGGDTGFGELVSTDLDRTAREAFRPLEGPFPNFDGIWPKSEPLARVEFAAAYLEDIAAVAKRNKGTGVRWTILPNGCGDAQGLSGAQRFDFTTPDGLEARGLLMPRRIVEAATK